MLYKTYCFAFQKRRFCTVKAAVLHRKTYAFATSTNYLYKIKGFFQCLYYATKRESLSHHVVSTELLHSLKTTIW